MNLVVNKGIEVFQSDVFDLSKLAEELFNLFLTNISTNSSDVDLGESFRISISSILTLVSSLIVKPTFANIDTCIVPLLGSIAYLLVVLGL